MFVLAFTGTARAQPTEAEQLFERARQLRLAGKLDEACEVFAKSYALAREPGTGLNLGECEEREHHLVKAWHIYQDAVTKYERAGTVGGARTAREHLATLAAQLGTIVIGVPDPELAGLSITINDRSVAPAAEIREVVVPGEVTITATAPGRASFERSREVAAGGTMVVELTFERTRKPVEDGHTETRRRRSRVYLAVGLGVGALAAGAVGLELALKANRDYDAAQQLESCQPRMEPPSCDEPGFSAIRDAQHLANVGTGFAVAAGGLAIASIVVFVTAPRDAVIVVPRVTGDSVGLSFTRTF